VAKLLLQQTNALRVEAGWGAVDNEKRLTAAAARFAAFMAEQDRYGHDADGRQPVERARAQGYDQCLIAENIAFASSTRGFAADELASRVFDGWTQSPPHRRNMLDSEMTEVGIATAQSARSGKHYVVQLFGRPRSLALRISLANRSRETVKYELGSDSFELKPGVMRTHDRCRRSLLALSTTDEGKGKPIVIAPGAHYRIEDGDGGGIRLRRQ
jgi:hypothetical protein